MLDNEGKNTSELCNPVLSALAGNPPALSEKRIDIESAECLATVIGRADILIKQYLDSLI